MSPPVSELREQIARCNLFDRRRFAGWLRKLERSRSPRREREQRLDALVRQVELAADAHERRVAAIPPIDYPPDLPVAQEAPRIAEAIREHQVVVVCGETGSGKTTQLPKICIEAGRGRDGLIGHTQPRRLAARAVAARIAEEMNVPLGGVVGAKVRFGDQTSVTTLVKLMTDGILLAESRGDRLLERYDTIIIDEAHERSLNIDFLLGYLTEVLAKRPDLKVVITSATIDPQRFADHFEKHLHAKTPVILVEGRSYPVEVRYRPPVEAPGADGDDDIASWSAETGDITAGVLAAMDEIENEPRGDVLVFMPGEREIRETAKALRKRYLGSSNVEVLPLYARLSYAEQKRIFAPHGGRRVVVATNVAETSITVPGIRYVIDPGLARISRYSPRSKVQGLPVEAISKASADQRKGRCGRVGPGVCYRLYSENDFEHREPFTAPEIMRTNLAGVVLQMASLRLGRPERFPFVEAPDGRLIRDGYETLREVGAVDADGNLTRHGEEMARLPIDPRIARMLIAGHHEGCLHEALIVASGLSIQDPRDRPAEQADAADEAHAQFKDPAGDFMGLLKLWQFYHDHIRPLSRSKRTKACAQNFLSERRLREWLEMQGQIRPLLSEMGYHFNTKPAHPDAVHRALLAGLLTSIGRKKTQSEYEGTRGARFVLHPSSSLFNERPKWVMVAELVRTTRLYGRTVAKIDPSWIEPIAGDLVKRSYAEPHYDERSARVMAYERVLLAGLEIVARRRVDYRNVDPVESRRLFIQHGLVDGAFETGARCIVHNRALERELSELEHKARRRDLLAEAEARFDFYDRRLPPDVCSGDTFEAWIRKAEREDPKFLFMAPEDVVIGDTADLTPESYPDRFRFGKTELTLDYRFDPADDRDGVTVDVPVSVLGQLGPDQVDRLVPGLLPAKIESLIRTLPKATRRQFDIGPLSRTLAGEFARGTGPLVGSLAGRLSQLTGVRITADMFREEAIDRHLRLNIRVVNDDGETLAEGRDLIEIKQTLAEHVEAGFREVASEKNEWIRDGLTDWTFGDLPKSVEIETETLTVHGYPAIVDQGDAVGLRLLDSPEAAKKLTRRGVMRLLSRRVRTDLKLTPDAISNFSELATLYATLGPTSKLRDELILLLAERVCVGDNKPPRTHAAFVEALDRGWNRLASTIEEVGPSVRQTLGRRQQILAILESKTPADWGPSLGDIREQLTLLFSEHFLTETPYRWLRCYPRYLRAMLTRIEKLRGGGVGRDRELAIEARKWQAKWTERRAKHDAEGVTDPELDEYRWMVEEYRVSLFAQDLTTAVSVSPKRLERQWEKVRP